MGYYIFSYGIEAERVRETFGSKNQRFLAEIEQNEVFENYSDFQPGGYKTTPAKALKEIINGSVFDAKSNYAYGYAIIGICATLGTDLPYTQEIKLGYDTDLVNDILSEDFGIIGFSIEEELLEDNNPFKIPRIDDWPLISLLTLSDLEELRSKLGDVRIPEKTSDSFSNTNEEDEDKILAYEHLNGILANVRFCIDNKLDMISFCH